MIRLIFQRLAGIVLFFQILSAPAYAHLTQNSEINLLIGTEGLRADIVIPQSEYITATAHTTEQDGASLSEAKAYLMDRFAIATPQGELWSSRIGLVEFVTDDGQTYLHAVAYASPPPKAPLRRFVVDWRAIVAEVPNHYALFLLQRDIAGQWHDSPKIIGAARSNATHITVDVGKASKWSELRNSTILGVEHIITGYDHIFFLLALLLPAPLVSKGRRWEKPKEGRGTLRHIFSIVTAFTIGHSLTLVGAATGGWQLPVQPVEIAIAVSVFLSSLHAIRPIFPNYEAWIAGGFGLVHGLAFATLVSDLQLGSASAPIALFGFNLGIELVQIVIVLIALPALMLLSRGQHYSSIRIPLASLATIAALIWIVDRIYGVSDKLLFRTEFVIELTSVIIVFGLAIFYLYQIFRRHRHISTLFSSLGAGYKLD